MRFWLLLPALFLAVPVHALCTIDGAYGIRFGEKIGVFAPRIKEPGLNSPYIGAYSVKAKEPLAGFDRYFVRADNDDKVIFQVSALKPLFEASPLMTGDDYRARIYPMLKDVADQVATEQGITFERKAGDFYTFFGTDIGIQINAVLDNGVAYAQVQCRNMKLNLTMEQRVQKRMFECIGDGAVHKPECFQGSPR